jgi:hypothetical protein
MLNQPSFRLLLGLVCFCGAAGQGFAANEAPQTLVPNFSYADFRWMPIRGVFLPPPSGPGPVTYDQAHPQTVRTANNIGLVQETTLRIADLNNPNLKPWVIDALKKANAERLAGVYMYASRASCRPAGVPMFLIHGAGFQGIYFIQTATETVMINSGNTEVRHVYMNVPHSAHPAPTWYGESVGHYEGDELVVDTIGFNDKTLLDEGFSVPHTAQLHVIERFKLIDDGKGLEVNLTVDDPGAFNAPWSAIVRYRRSPQAQPLREDVCAENNINVLGDRNIMPMAARPDF